jgi:hypothetical protein
MKVGIDRNLVSTSKLFIRNYKNIKTCLFGNIFCKSDGFRNGIFRKKANGYFHKLETPNYMEKREQSFQPDRRGSGIMVIFFGL